MVLLLVPDIQPQGGKLPKVIQLLSGSVWLWVPFAYKSSCVPFSILFPCSVAPNMVLSSQTWRSRSFGRRVWRLRSCSLKT